MDPHNEHRHSRLAAHGMILLAALLGGVSLLVLVVFLFVGSFGLVDLGLGETAALWWDAWLCLAFFLQHSVMIRRSFRRRLERFIPPHYHGATYSVASGVVLLLLVVLWQESARTLVALQGPFRWLLRAVFFVSMVGTTWGFRALRSFDAFGLGPLLAHVRGTPLPPMPLTIRGPYRWVRHPLYFFVLLLIWSCPDLTADRLLFNVVWTAWVVVGTMLEERDLVADFGEAYRDYQRRVPMLIPYRIRSAQPTEKDVGE